jgi:hypothetical protein
MVEALAEVQLLIQDGAVEIGDATGGRETKELLLPADVNDRFLDGPACRRIAVVDFDPETGAPLPPPARFVAGRTSRVRGSYHYDGDPTSPSTLAINAFGTVFQTVRLFEGPQALGRQVRWAFGSEQLLVVPRAGEWDNAFYDRETRSLQFFFFARQGGGTVYTALSRDIVAHECGHALLDAVVPSLYDSSTPQSIAIHEAVADLIAVLMALDSETLRTAVLKRTGNDLLGANAFSSIAEEFGLARPGPNGVARGALRELDNPDTLATLTRERARPHRLSTLLSGILYETLAAIFDTQFRAELEHPSDAEDQTPAKVAERAANKALGSANIIFRRLLLRGIDYLPPGELSFADVGRATLAAERSMRPEAEADAALKGYRQAYAQRFVTRGVVESAADLDSDTPPELGVAAERVEQLHDSDWACYGYVDEHRALLGIPDGTAFTVLPRVDATKRVGRARDGAPAPEQRELIIKVAWNHVEDSGTPLRGVRRRNVATGATIALHWPDGRCLALVTSDVTAARHREGRDGLLRQLADDGLLDDADDALRIRVAGGVATLSGSQRLLHLAGWEEQ